MRVAIIGNAGSGKSTLAVQLAARYALPLHEMDRLMWQEGWAPAPAADFAEAHAEIIAQESWLIDGMGNRASLEARLARATHILLCDYPLWQNYWLLAQRQADWAAGKLELPPGGQAKPPETRDLFKMVWTIDQDFMPFVRTLVSRYAPGRQVIRFADFDALTAFDGVLESVKTDGATESGAV